MATYNVHLNAIFSNVVTVEVNDDVVDDYEITEKAVQMFEAEWLPYSSVGGYTYVWDSVELEEIEETD